MVLYYLLVSSLLFCVPLLCSLVLSCLVLVSFMLWYIMFACLFVSVSSLPPPVLRRDRHLVVPWWCPGGALVVPWWCPPCVEKRSAPAPPPYSVPAGGRDDDMIAPLPPRREEVRGGGNL